MNASFKFSTFPLIIFTLSITWLLFEITWFKNFTIFCNNLFFENVPDEIQPGVYVRRINGKELNDEEMIEHYSKLAQKFGGKIESCWVYGMVVYNGTLKKEYSWKKDKFYIIDTPSIKRNSGYPLDSISIVPDLNKYFVDLTDEERNSNKNDISTNKVVKFIVDSINELNK